MNSPNSFKTLAFVVAVTSSLFAANASANVFDYSNTGVIQGSSGSYYLVEGSKVTQISQSQAMEMRHKFPINTTKGPREVEFVRGATAHMPKVGAAVSKFAQRVGPIGMTLATVDLVCSLSNICNTNGEWIVQGNDPYPGLPNSYPATDGKWWGWTLNGVDSYYPSTDSACGDSVRISQNLGNPSEYVFDHTEYVNDNTYKCFARRISSGTVSYASNTSRYSGCADNYSLVGSNCVKNGVSQSGTATTQDWTNAESSLNDDRFLPDLISNNEQIPINLPTITGSPLRQQLTKETAPTLDSSGTQTGTKETATELVITDASTADKPNQIDIKEETTVTYKDMTGAVIGTIATTTTEVSQQPAPQSQLCGLPGQEPCNVLVDERGVQTAIETLNPLGQAATQSITSIFDATEQSITTRAGGVGQGFQWPWQINAGNCAPLVMDSQKGLVFDICPQIPLIHQILGYVFYVLTAIAIFNVFFQPKTT